MPRGLEKFGRLLALAVVPAATLHAERPDARPPGPGASLGHDAVHAERAILPAPLHHVAGLRVEVSVHEVLHLQFTDFARFVQPRTTRPQGLVQGQEKPLRTRRRGMQKVNRKVAMGEGFRDQGTSAQIEQFHGVGCDFPSRYPVYWDNRCPTLAFF